MSAEALRQIRAEKQKKYEAEQRSQAHRQIPGQSHASLDSQRCADCAYPSYLTSICPATGKRHDLQKKKIIGGLLVDMDCTALKGDQLIEAINSARVRWQPSRTKHVKVDEDVVSIFQSFAITTQWSVQRYGVLYGKHEKDNETIEVHAIYEPMQHGNAFSFELLDLHSAEGRQGFEEEQRVNLLAQRLGLRRVGVICSHPYRPGVSVLSSRELLLCAREQSIYGDECVLLTVTPHEERQQSSDANSPNTNVSSPASLSESSSNAMASRCEAWQASEQCVRLYQMGMLVEDPKFSEAKGEISVVKMIHSPHLALEVTEEKRDPRTQKLQFQTLAPEKRIDSHWCTCYIAVEKFHSDVVRNVFMRRHRPGMANPLPANLKQYWNDPKRAGAGFLQRVSDFQVLLYLATEQALGAEAVIGKEALKSGGSTPALAAARHHVHLLSGASAPVLLSSPSTSPSTVTSVMGLAYYVGKYGEALSTTMTSKAFRSGGAAGSSRVRIEPSHLAEVKLLEAAVEALMKR